MALPRSFLRSQATTSHDGAFLGCSPSPTDKQTGDGRGNNEEEEEAARERLRKQLEVDAYLAREDVIDDRSLHFVWSPGWSVPTPLRPTNGTWLDAGGGDGTGNDGLRGPPVVRSARVGRELLTNTFFVEVDCAAVFATTSTTAPTEEEQALARSFAIAYEAILHGKLGCSISSGLSGCPPSKQILQRLQSGCDEAAAGAAAATKKKEAAARRMPTTPSYSLASASDRGKNVTAFYSAMLTTITAAVAELSTANAAALAAAATAASTLEVEIAVAEDTGQQLKDAAAGAQIAPGLASLIDREWPPLRAEFEVHGSLAAAAAAAAGL